jgi:hypothetical protein
MGVVITNLNDLVNTSIDGVVSSNVNVVAAQQAITDAEAAVTIANGVLSSAEQSVLDAQSQVGLASDQVVLAAEQVGLAEDQAVLAQGYADTAATVMVDGTAAIELVRDEVIVAKDAAEQAVVDAGTVVTTTLEAYTDAAEQSAASAEATKVEVEGIRDQVVADVASIDGVATNVALTQQEVTELLAASRAMYDHYDDRYLGGHSDDPILDNDGDDILDGALYWNTTDKMIKVFSQTALAWSPVKDADGSLLVVNNLNDITDVAAARANLDVLSSSEVATEVATEVVTEVAEQLDAQKGVVNGIAELDGSGLVPASQLPSYVDDVIEVATYADLPVTGESGKIYIVVADETRGESTTSYRWAGSVYALTSNTLNGADVKALYEGEADTNAYTDAEKTKLADTEITSQLDARDIANKNTDNHTDGVTNGVYTLAERSKLAGIEAGATADQTGAEIKLAYEAEADTNAYTDSEKMLVDVGTPLDTTSTTLPSAINEVHGEVDAHIADTVDAHAASAIGHIGSRD